MAGTRHTAWRTRHEVLLGVVEDELADGREVLALLAGFRAEELVVLVRLRRAAGADLRETAAGVGLLGVDAVTHVTGGRCVAGGELGRVVAVLSAVCGPDRRPRVLGMHVVPVVGERLQHGRAVELPDGGGAAAGLLVDVLAREPVPADEAAAVVASLRGLGHHVHLGPAAPSMDVTAPQRSAG